jgi:hypothetical protein
MLAVSTDEFSVLIIDCDIKKIVRKFVGHSNKISDMVTLNFKFHPSYEKFSTSFLNQKGVQL